MAMTTSELAIIVKSQGIKDASEGLTNLAVAAKSVDAETRAFITSAQKMGDVNIKAAKNAELLELKITKQKLSIQALTERTERLTSAHANLQAKQEQSSNDKLAREFDKQEAASRRAAQAIEAQERAMTKQHIQALKMNETFDKQARGLDEVNTRGNVYVNTLRSMATAALAYVGVNFFTDVIKQADAWSLAQSKLKLATGSMEGAVVAQRDLFEISQKLRVPLEDTTKLFTRMMVPLQKMGKTSSDAKDMVQSFSTALKLSGATGQEAASAMLQFSQSLNAGRLNGGEFNSIAEASPNILRAVEAEFTRLGVSIGGTSGGLKRLAADGKITTEVLYNAIKNASPKWTKEFESLPLTVDGALTRIKNAWGKAIGELGQDTKFNEKMANSLKNLEEMLPSIAKSIVSAFSFLVDNGETILKVFAGIASASVLFSIGSLATSMMTAYTSIVAVTGAVGGLTKALALVGITPVGLALTAVGVALASGVYLWDKYSNGVTEADKARAKLLEGSGNILKSIRAENKELEDQIDKLRLARGEQALYNKEKFGGTAPRTALDDSFAKAQEAYKNYQQSKMKWDAVADKTRLVNSEIFLKMKKDEKAAIQSNFEYEQVRVAFVENKAKKFQVAGEAELTERKKIQDSQEEMLMSSEAKAAKKRDDARAKLKLDMQGNVWLPSMEANQNLIIEKEYQKDIDKIKTPKSEKEAEKNLKAYANRMTEIADKTRNLNTEIEGMQKYDGAWEKMLPEQKNFENLLANYDKLVSKIGAVNAAKERDAAMSLANAALAKQYEEGRIKTALDLESKEAQALDKAKERLGVLERHYKFGEGIKEATEKEKLANTNKLIAELESQKIAGARLDTLKETARVLQQIVDLEGRENIVKVAGIMKGLNNSPEMQDSAAKTQLGLASQENIGIIGAATSKEGFGKDVSENPLVTLEQAKADAILAINRKLSEDIADIDRNRLKMQLSAAEGIAGSLASIAENAGGKQTAAYKAMFAIQKGFTIASAALDIQKAISDAMGKGFPFNIPLIAQAVAGGATIMKTIKGIGFETGGYTGNMGTKEVAGVVHGQEFVVNAQNTARYRSVLEGMNMGLNLEDMVASSATSYDKAPASVPQYSSGSTKGMVINIENHGTDVQVEQISANEIRLIARQEAASIVRKEAGQVVASELASPNSNVSKALVRNTQTSFRRD
jgi:tape measure domain-containing protein